MIGVNELVPMFLFTLLIGFCGFFGPSARNVEGMEGCYDDTCFLQSFEECSLSYGTINTDIVTIYMEVLGPNNQGTCDVYVRLDNINSSKVPDEYKTFSDVAKYSDMNCKLNNVQRDLLLSGQFNEELINNCEGSLATVLKSIAPQFNN